MFKSYAPHPIPTNKVGIGLRSFYIDHILQNLKQISKKIGWFEVHSENYYNHGASSFQYLIEVRENFPISFHSVGNSLGSSQNLDRSHLKKLKELIQIFDPFLVSDHISWGAVDKKHLNDLLPLPYSQQSLKAISQNISLMQDFLQRQILIENPSTYITFKDQEMDEAEFINEVAKKTGCGLLLDVNNVFVSASNNEAFEVESYLKKIDRKIVKEIHVAGHSISKIFDGENYKRILIDTHNDVVCDEVWEIYKMTIKRFGQVPSLVEWDQDFPEFKVLLGEARKVERILKS